MTPADLPARSGPRPAVYKGLPQHQTEQHPDRKNWAHARSMVDTWANAVIAPSRRAAPGTMGLFVDDEKTPNDDERFLIGREFAHHHPDTDGGLHMVLPDAWVDAVLKQEWGEPHLLAGKPTVSRLTVLIYAPRDDAELAVVKTLIGVSQEFAESGCR